MANSELRQRLEKLLSEDIQSVLNRESEALESIVGSLDQPFLLFGAGNLGRKVLRKLKSIGKLPAAFIDNNPNLWGTDIEGVSIMAPTEAANKFDAATIGVITTIWCGEATDKMSDRINPIRALGFKKIALFGHLAWKFQDEFLPHYCLDRPSKVIANADNIRRAFSLLADNESRLLFVDHIEWRLFLDYDLLPSPSSEEIYFNDRFVSNSVSEVLYDIGAYTGDSVASYLKTPRGAKFAEIHSFEPSSNNYVRLKNYVETLGELKTKIHSHQLALGDTVGSIKVETGNGPSSRVGVGNQPVPMTTIDLFSQSHSPPTFIKIDIEGFEPQCLNGAQSVINGTAPVVALSVYHLQSHLWELLLQLHSFCSGYTFSLCGHCPDGWDLVLYAVPESRLPDRR
jgi:FkbM family methyltransferase